MLPTAIYLVTITFFPSILAVKYLLQTVWRKIRQKMISEFFCQTLGVSTSAAPAFSRCLSQQFSPPLGLTAPTHVLPGGPLKVTSLLASFLGGWGYVGTALKSAWHLFPTGPGMWRRLTLKGYYKVKW